VRDTGFSAILSKAPAIIEKLDSVLLQINQVLGEENRDLVSGMLMDFASVTEALASQKETVGELPALLKSSLEQINSSLAQLRSMAGKLEPDLLSSVANLEQMTENLVKLTARLEHWAATNDGDVNAFMADGLGQVPVLMSEAQTTLREIQKLVKEIREDPSTLIYQPSEATIEVER
jgi:phospholipid/cholesterol/gamma-HCH transport system substrate-binding protein